MLVLLTCKNEEDPIKIESARVLTRLYINFSTAQGQLTPQSVVNQTHPSFMVVLVTCKNEEDIIKNDGARVLNEISPIISQWDFSDAHGS